LSLSCLVSVRSAVYVGVLTRVFTIIAIVCVETNYLNIVLIGVHIKSTMRARFARHVLTRVNGTVVIVVGLRR
jgi:hypothetical protein